MTQTGADDDIVQGMFVLTYYLYRYPILGPPLKKPDGSPVFPNACDGCRPFYEVTIPGQAQPSNGYGRDLAWYQPSWQNGDALCIQNWLTVRWPSPIWVATTTPPPTASQC